MADATVPRARQDESLVQPTGRELEPVEPTRVGSRWLMVALWAIFAVATLAFLALGSVRVQAGNWTGRRMAVSRIWGRFVGYLADQGASQPVILVVSLAAVITLVGSIGMIWLAFSVRDDRPAPPDDTPGG